MATQTATTAQVAEVTKYPCDTQENDQPSFGAAPLSNLAGTTGDNAPDEPDDLVIGFGEIIPRWDINRPTGRKLGYFVRTETFPSPDQAKTAALKFQEAADSWNELDLGITIAEADSQDNANFYLTYEVGRTGSRTLARAFFPHEIDQDVIVFKKAFDSGSLACLKNIFQHEIGHILGLRHEFAITGDESKKLPAEKISAVQFRDMNYNSIMGYNMPPKMQDSDRESTIEFYKLANGFMMGSSPVTDYVPQIRRRNR